MKYFGKGRYGQGQENKPSRISLLHKGKHMKCVGLRIFILLFLAKLTCIAEKSVKIKNLDELIEAAKQGDSNALCLIGVHEFLGGQIYDPRIIETVTIEQILLSKQADWQRRVVLFSKEDDNGEIKTGEKIKNMVSNIKQSADLDNKIAQYCYGKLLANGIGVEENDQQSFLYFLKSAEKGFPSAFSAVGDCYNSGRGTSLDEKKAIEWFRKGIDAGDTDSKVKIGRAYLYGWGVEKDQQKGFKIIEEASACGSSYADSEIGHCYLNGIGTKQNYGKALVFLKSASQIDISAKVDLGLMYLRGQGTPKDSKKGVQLIEEAGKTGDSYAQNMLAHLYKDGEGLPLNTSKATNLFQKSAKKGNPDSMYELGLTYYLGNGDTPKDRDLSIKYLKQAEQLGNEAAKAFLLQIKESSPSKTSLAIYTEAMDTLYSKTTKDEKEQAIKKLEKISEEGSMCASYQLGKQYLEGLNINKNTDKAINLFIKVANSKQESDKLFQSKALNILGYLYDKGEGLEKNYEKAFEFYQKAALLNHSGAKANIGLYYYYGNKNVQKDFPKALQQFLQSVENLTDEKDAFRSKIMILIGNIYSQHMGDNIEGNKWYSRAISCKYPSFDAFYWLGQSYYYGRGVDQNKETATELFRQGAKMGDKRSGMALTMIENGKTP